MKIKFRWIVCTCALLSLFVYFEGERRVLKRKSRRHTYLLDRIQDGILSTRAKLGNITIPKELQTVPMAEDQGIVLNAKSIDVRGVMAPYNASIIERDGGGYWLFFRYDVVSHDCPQPFYTYIGCAELDEQFNQTDKEFWKVGGVSEFSEDPRINKVGNEYFLSYNSLVPGCIEEQRTIRVGRVNFKKQCVDFESNLDLNLTYREKNWTPFEFINEKGQPELCFEYSAHPHKILCAKGDQKERIEQFIHKNLVHLPSPWQSVYGMIRGGTPPIMVDGQYLTFFHSAIRDHHDHITWYFMGAYTFEATPPFRITGISNYPILFKGIYTTPRMHTAPTDVKCIFPAGVARETRNGRELLHVSCGENDSGVKVVTIDQEQLLKSLQPINLNRKG